MRTPVSGAASARCTAARTASSGRCGGGWGGWRRRGLEGVPSAGTNQNRIEELRRRNAELQGRIDQLQADRRTAAQLAQLRRAAAGAHRLLPARVVGLGPGQGFDWTVTLDVGTKDGAGVGLTVTDG